MQGLRVELCDLSGARRPNGLIEEHTGLEVEIELNELRTCRFTTSLWEPATLDMTVPLTRLIRVFAEGVTPPIFVGPTLLPAFDFDAETVEVAAVGIEYRLQKAFLDAPLTVADRDVGGAMWDLITRASNRAYPVASPGLGIQGGSMPATFPINRTWEAGQNIWDAVNELADMAGAPDIEFAPLNRGDYVHVQFNAPAPQGSDRTGEFRWEYGWGRQNASGFKFEPGGDAVYTTYTSTGPAPDDGSLTQPAYTAHHAGQETEIGLYEGYEANDADSQPVQEAKAREMVGAYHDPPDYYTVTPANEPPSGVAPNEWGTPPQFMREYFVGDTTRTIAKKAGHSYNLAGRLRKATVKQVDDESGGWLVELEHAPNVDPSGVT